MHGKFDDDSRSAPRCSVDVNVAAVIGHESTNDGESETGPLWLRCVKAAKRTSHLFVRHSGSRVGDDDAHHVIPLLGGDRDRASLAWQTLEPVRHEVVEHPSQRNRIAEYGGKLVAQMHVKGRGIGVSGS